MKKRIIYFACFIVGFFSIYKSQNKTGLSNYNFIKQMEVEIKDIDLHKTLFSDTVTFQINEKAFQVFQEKTIRENWNKVEMLFRNTDYVINPYENDSNKIPIKQLEHYNYYVLKNHKYIYVLGLNKQGKISFVQGLKYKLPANAPR